MRLKTSNGSFWDFGALRSPNFVREVPAMHRRALLLSVAAAALAACTNTQANPLPAPGVAPQNPSGSFDIDLYRAVAGQPGNQFVSPYSVASSFALVYPGASGETRDEIGAVFGFDLSPAAEARTRRDAATAITHDNGGSEFSVANAAWVERTMALRPEYARTIEEDAGGTISPVDFIADQSAALRQINAWAAHATHDRIPSILSGEDPDRRLVLTNAVYFKGAWRDQFPASQTKEGDFHAGDATIRAHLMHQVTSARYVERDTVQVADFDYDAGAFALAVFLPRERTGLSDFERALTGEVLDNHMMDLAAAPLQRLDLTLPKVEMHTDYELAPQLRQLGVRRAFGGDADFSAISTGHRLNISAVIQKAFLAIDEQGTEAAAITAVDMVATAARRGPPPPPPIEFKADRPFFIVLHHRPSRTRLFLGRVVTPS